MMHIFHEQQAAPVRATYLKKKKYIKFPSQTTDQLHSSIDTIV